MIKDIRIAIVKDKEGKLVFLGDDEIWRATTEEKLFNDLADTIVNAGFGKTGYSLRFKIFYNGKWKIFTEEELLISFDIDENALNLKEVLCGS